jgi:hypothetical protein
MSQMIRSFAFLLLIAGAAITASSIVQEPVLPPLPAETHALDSLLGTWTFIEELHNPKYPSKLTGTWAFNLTGDGFMIIDEFRSFNGSGGTALLGETYRAYNPDKKAWSFQATLYQSPTIGRRNGEWDAGTTRIQGGQIFDEVTKGSTISRARFYNLKQDSFSCVFDTSNDSGKTWVNPVDIEAVRAQK